MSEPAANRLIADRYALIAPLGRGGMGVVWRAQDAVLGREVDIKEVVFPATMPEAERRPARARVMREARAAARLNHPAAVTLYDVVTDQGGTFIVMELVNAPTLADLVREGGPLPVERVAEIGVQVAGALEAAHAAGIVHRDVKPGNVMVGERGVAKLADFGIASLQGDPQLTSTGLVIGSPAYMAPEQAKGEPSGPAADFWALGATMFYAVEGGPPFDRGASIATLAAVVNDPPRRPERAGPLAPRSIGSRGLSGCGRRVLRASRDCKAWCSRNAATQGVDPGVPFRGSLYGQKSASRTLAALVGATATSSGCDQGPRERQRYPGHPASLCTYWPRRSPGPRCGAGF
jgi:serine/threonine protein kinase